MKRLFIQFVLPLLSLVALSSCESDDDSPSIPPAILEKVNEMDNCLCNPELHHYFWYGRVVYNISTAKSLCLSVFVLYDHNGNEVPIPDGYGFDNFMENSTFLGVLWTCDENGE